MSGGENICKTPKSTRFDMSRGRVIVSELGEAFLSNSLE